MKNKVSELLDKRIREYCNRLTQKQQKTIVCVLVVVFGTISLFITIRSIYLFGKNDMSLPEIRHIDSPILEKNDTLNLLKIPQNERG